jgi:hypothetical protein
MYPFLSSQQSKDNQLQPTSSVAFESNLSAESVQDEQTEQILHYSLSSCIMSKAFSQAVATGL